MDIFYNKKQIEQNRSIPKLYTEDIEFYAKQLHELVTLYRRHIFVEDEKTERALSELEYYANLFTNKDYNALITNASELIVEDEKSPFPF